MRFLFLIVVLFAACAEPVEKERSIDLAFSGLACDCDCECANWNSQDDINKFGENRDTLVKLSVFIEPADSTLKFPDSLGREGDLLRFTGRFDAVPGVPAYIDYNGDPPEKARIFRYTKYEIVKRDYHLYWKTPDTMVVDSRSAVLYTPDSLQMEKKMWSIGDRYFRIGMGDYAAIMNEAAEYLESQKLQVIVSQEKRYLAFKNQNSLIRMVNTDTLPDLWGIYLFNPPREPKFIDITNAESEYKQYFK